MPHKTYLFYFLCGIINLEYCYESGKLVRDVEVVKKNADGIPGDSLNAFSFSSGYLPFSSKRRQRPPMGCPTSGGPPLVDA